jgi:hypothetical protein
VTGKSHRHELVLSHCHTRHAYVTLDFLESAKPKSVFSCLNREKLIEVTQVSIPGTVLYSPPKAQSNIESLNLNDIIF